MRPSIGDTVVGTSAMENNRATVHPRTHRGRDMVSEGSLGESSTATVVHDRGLTVGDNNSGDKASRIRTGYRIG
ncbi:hypothetical protein V6N12_073313 [Hibiscus sabdariffa]|uniref:Uncharacterized protein n=1 Tax=Hibiscus sabdariffa TaxID=183260 RepID=A0ABR2AEV3_9ROSI